jgi:hypothetical protein
MKKKYNRVYQFKITLGGSTPPIWRRIQVPETYTFWDLHVAIQDVMGWSGHHLYDFGDAWVHEILLEKILPREKGVTYPRCLKGRRACPPEDSGGIWGYDEILEVIRDPQHDDYEEMREWVGDEFDPAYFDVNAVTFRDPDKLLKMGFK